MTRGSVLPDHFARRVLLPIFRKVTYVEMRMSMGLLYLNSQARKMKPKARRSKPCRRNGSGKAKLEGIPKMIVSKYPNVKKTAIITRTISGTKTMALALIDLNIPSLIFSL